MKPETLDLLCSPRTHQPLQLSPSLEAGQKTPAFLTNPQNGERYPIRDGIPVFLAKDALDGMNQKYQKMYNRIAPLYDFSTWIYAALKSGGERSRRMEYLSGLEIHTGDRVLEVSVGTGGNLECLSPDALYYGIDISWGMLRQCQRKVSRGQIDAELMQCSAEELCFKDEVFDVVFHVGGINYFNDKAGSIREMIRVAKPGTKLILVDETEEFAKKFENKPGSAGFYKNRPERISAPVDLIPAEMKEVKVELVGNGDLYCLSFRKPRD